MQDVRREVLLLRSVFGSKPVEKITYDDLRRFKNKRLATPIVRDVWEKYEVVGKDDKKKTKKRKVKKTTARSFASVHRELARMRRILNIAVRQGWLKQNPFNSGEPLIQTTLERERVRIATFDEEKRLLANARAGASI